ncbi:MAG: hypothetical protein ACI9PP_000999 [Halobacteriales archaeon]|jgi:hypothetical protein
MVSSTGDRRRRRHPRRQRRPDVYRLEEDGLVEHRDRFWAIADAEHAVASAELHGAATAAGNKSRMGKPEPADVPAVWSPLRLPDGSIDCIVTHRFVFEASLVEFRKEVLGPPVVDLDQHGVLEIHECFQRLLEGFWRGQLADVEGLVIGSFRNGFAVEDGR